MADWPAIADTATHLGGVIAAFIGGAWTIKRQNRQMRPVVEGAVASETGNLRDDITALKAQYKVLSRQYAMLIEEVKAYQELRYPKQAEDSTPPHGTKPR